MNETTPPIMTINDELLAELEAAADAATPGPWEHIRVNDISWVASEDWEILDLRCDKPLDAEDGSYIAQANPETIKALLAHIVGLKQQLAEAEEGSGVMRLIALIGSIRMASGDQGRHMQDELPGFIGELRRDAERYRWLREKHNDENGICWASVWDRERVEWVSLDKAYIPDFEVFETPLDLDAAIDAARSAGGGS